MRTHFAALTALAITTGCTVGSGAVVKGAGPDDLLKLREGPGLNYRIIVGLPDGTPLTRQNCVTNSGKVWCKVSLTDMPGISGYVSADYLAHR
ncbi:SH3 domain-containing protein [Paracoccus sp. SCSIO 75233]|uniref:SH3 domain-containing protein n=1 Tax=Paracoccus sp. SCSIO 75233 TaxID=3017782 RepID=UPI0022F03492|nr:SH3 domain-containing protein [Paracoccus sp. SCSIO 75233]WBU53025.1 SH3 domain-containing protein [Paracoccus sp. SCSIO 75233]